MLATRCTIRRKETMTAPDEPTDHTLEFAVDDFTVTVTAKHVRQEPWENFVTALTRLLVDPIPNAYRTRTRCNCDTVTHHETDCPHPDNDWAREPSASKTP